MNNNQQPLNAWNTYSHNHCIYDPGHSQTPIEVFIAMRRNLVVAEKRVAIYKERLDAFKATMSEEQQQEAMIEILKESDD